MNDPFSSCLRFLLCGSLLASPLVALPAMEHRPDGTQEEGSDDSARALRRVLHLVGGGSLRAVARRDAEGWHVRSGAGWRTLPAAAVARVALERDVLAEAKRLERSLGEGPSGRVELATWMLAEGLLEEAVTELDRVLEADPLNPDAIALVGSRGLFRLPSEPEADPAQARAALLSWAVGASPAMREAAIQELARAEREALHAELRAALASRILTRRAFAAQALGRILPGEELKNLLLLAVLDPAEDVRRHASVALSASGDPAVTVPVVRALWSRDPRVVTQAAEALGHMGFTAAVEPLMTTLAAVTSQGGRGAGSRVPRSYVFIGRQFAYLQDFDVEVAQFQAVADPSVNVLLEGDVLEAGVHAVTSYGVAYQSQVIRGSLGKLTGQSPGRTARAWLDWWERNQDEWRSGAPSGHAEGSR